MKKFSVALIVLMLGANILSSGIAFGADTSLEKEVSVPVVSDVNPETLFEQVSEAAEYSEEEAKPAQLIQVLDEDVHRYIGNFTITHYCICSRCCGKSSSNPAYGITSTGTRATSGRTIAVDPRKIPYGTEVVINDHVYVAEDCGGAIKNNRIDIFVDSHYEALQKGVLRNVPVYIVE